MSLLEKLINCSLIGTCIYGIGCTAYAVKCLDFAFDFRKIHFNVVHNNSPQL
jgi:hypothetical protein